MRAAFLLFLVGCDDTLFGPTQGPDTGAIVHPTYDDVEGIWAASCAGCHTDGGSQGGLVLDGGEDLLIGVPSTEAPEVNLVTYGDPPSSYLWLKITDAPEIVGASMPQGQPLTDGEIGTITNWINGGTP